MKVSVTSILFFCIASMMSQAWGQVPWTFEPTGKNHSIRLNFDDNLMVDGNGLNEGDAIGLFYDSPTGLLCAGYAVLEESGSEYIIEAYGEDGVLPGYRQGELLKFKVWLEAEKCEISNIDVSYVDGTNSSDTFLINGNNVLESLSGAKVAVDYEKSSYCKSETNPVPLISNGATGIVFEAEGDEGLVIDRVTGEIDLAKSWPGQYSIFVMSDIQCLQASFVDVVILDIPVSTLPKELEICGLQEEVVLEAGEGFDSYKWSTGENSPQITVEGPGEYWVEVRNRETGCFSQRQFVDVVLLQPDLSALKLEIIQPNCDEGGKVKIDTASIPGYLSSYTYTLTNEFTKLQYQGKGDTISEIPEGTYELMVTGLKNCTVTYDGIVMLNKEDCKYPILSPNGDGIGDTYFIDERGQANIYDRFGKLRRTLVIPSFWDGTDSRGEFLPMGSYIIICNNSKEIPITLIK